MGKWSVLIVLAAAQFLMVLDQSVMNVSISQLVADFDTTVTTIQAVITLYSLVMAPALTELLAAKLLTYHAAHAFDSEPDPKIVHGKVAMAKLFASEMAGRVADRAVQIFGGRGYMTEYPAERHFRELRVDRIWEGTSEIQRVIVARGLLKRGRAAYDR